MKKHIIILYTFLSLNMFGQDYCSDIFDDALEVYKEGDLKLADSLLTISINCDSIKSKYVFLKYYNRGVIRSDINEFELAKKDLIICLELKQNFYPAHENLARCLLLNKEAEKAVKYIDSISPIYDYQNKLEFNAAKAIGLVKLNRFEDLLKLSTDVLNRTEDSRFLRYKVLSYVRLNRISYADTYVSLYYANYPITTYLMEAKFYYLVAKKEYDLASKLLKDIYLKDSSFPLIYEDEEINDIVKSVKEDLIDK